MGLDFCSLVWRPLPCPGILLIHDALLAASSFLRLILLHLSDDLQAAERERHDAETGDAEAEVHPTRRPDAQQSRPVTLFHAARVLDRHAPLAGYHGSLQRRGDGETDGASELADGVDESAPYGLVLGRQGAGREQREGGPDRVRSDDGQDHGPQGPGEIARFRRDGHREQQAGDGDADVAAAQYEDGRDLVHDLGDNDGHQRTRHTSRDEAQHCVQRRQPLEVLEVVRREDEVVVEGGEEEAHDEHNGAEAQVVEHGHLDEGRLLAPLLEVALPEEKCHDNEDRHNYQNGDPGCRPSDHVTLCQRKEKEEEADGDEDCADPVNRSSGPLLPALPLDDRGRRWRNDEEAGHGDQASHDGRGAKDPFPIGILSDETGEYVAEYAPQGRTGCVGAEGVILCPSGKKGNPQNSNSSRHISRSALVLVSPFFPSSLLFSSLAPAHEVGADRGGVNLPSRADL